MALPKGLPRRTVSQSSRDDKMALSGKPHSCTGQVRSSHLIGQTGSSNEIKRKQGEPGSNGQPEISPPVFFSPLLIFAQFFLLSFAYNTVIPICTVHATASTTSTTNRFLKIEARFPYPNCRQHHHIVANVK